MQLIVSAMTTLSESLQHPIQCILAIAHLNGFPHHNGWKESDEIREYLLKPNVLKKLVSLYLTLSSRDQSSLLSLLEPAGVNRHIIIEHHRFHQLTRKLDPKDGFIAKVKTLGAKISKSNFVPFSEASVWREQQNFYCSKGLEAFDDVPSRISSNSHVSSLYLQQIDFIAQLRCEELSKPLRKINVCVIEICAGHSQLSLQIARNSLQKVYSCFCVATDCHDSNFKKLLKEKFILSLCELGVLDFSILAAPMSSDDVDIRNSFLLYNQEYLKCMQTKKLKCFDCVVIVANYAFDSIPVDIIVSVDGKILFEVGSPTVDSCLHEDISADNSGNKSRIKAKYICREIKRESDYIQKWDSSDTMFQAGVHMVPVGGAKLLNIVKDVFDVEDFLPSFSLLVGDNFMSPQESLSSTKGDFDSILQTPGYESGEVYEIPSFDPPLLSPVPKALAVPPSREWIFHVFKETFVSANGCIKLEMVTSNALSEFIVYRMMMDARSMTRGREKRKFGDIDQGREMESNIHIHIDSDCVHPCLTCVAWGPSEFVMLWELLAEKTLTQRLSHDRILASAYQDAASYGLQMLSQCDLPFFLDIRWSLMKAMRTTCSIGYRSWESVATRALEYHYATSSQELYESVVRIAQWLVVCNTTESHSQVIQRHSHLYAHFS